MAIGSTNSFAAIQHSAPISTIKLQLFAQHNDYQAGLIAKQINATETFFQQLNLQYKWPQQVRVNVYDSLARFNQVQVQRWNKVISFSGFYDARQQVVGVLSEGNTQQILQRIRHELVHVLLATNYPNAPAWLHEGLAEAFENQAQFASRPYQSFQHWLKAMQTFSADNEHSYQSAVAGARFLIQHLDIAPNIIALLASGNPLSPVNIKTAELQWQEAS